jgi:uncharacterized protein DUF6798
MITVNLKTKARLLLIGNLLLLFIFAFSFPQLPLYSSHQNTYLLHGLANAGMGFLGGDWLAQTTDPFPAFSVLVRLTLLTFGENTFYFFFIAIVAIYGYSILGIAGDIFGIDRTSEKYLTYFVLLTVLDSGLLAGPLLKVPVLSPFAPILEPDGLLTRGVAYQSILGQVFQPSLFGVFLVLSIFFFLREKPFLAVACCVIAATFHSSYFLSAAVLTGIYMAVILIKDKDYRKALFLGAMGLLLITPALLYAYLNFRPTTPDIYAQGQNILVNGRIPYHAIVAKWFGQSALFQILVVVWSIYLVRRTKIFPILLGMFLASGLLTIVQMLTGNQSLALVLPWRMSTVLVPIASSLILAKFVSVIFQIGNTPLSKWMKPLQTVILTIIMVLGYLGVHQTITLLHSPRAGLTASARFVASTYQPGNLYLIPTNLELFRLAAKVPILVDYQSNPYKDTDVVEWFKRVEVANNFYASSGKTACHILDNITDQYKITHVVLKSQSSIPDCGLLHGIYKDAEFAIYTVNDDEKFANLEKR